MRRFSRPLARAFVLAVFMCAANGVSAATLTLAWDQTPGATGYVLHWGTAPGVYTSSVNVGSQTFRTLTGLANGGTYYLAVRSYNAVGFSDFSTEVAARFTANGEWIPTPGDFNTDGKADLVWRQMQTGDVAMWQMGGAVVQNSPIIASGVPLVWQVAEQGDLNGDGQTDLIWRNVQTGDVAAWLMAGDSVRQAPVIAAGVPLVWQTVAAADLNADKKADLIWRNTQTGDVAAWLMNGTTATAAPVIARGVPLHWKIVAIGDLNGDAKADLVWRDLSNGDVATWLMNGAAMPLKIPVISRGVPLAWEITRLVDLNGDGRADIVWRNQQNGDVSAWLMNAENVVQNRLVSSGLPLEWQLARSADLDADGKSDLVWRNRRTGDVAAWLMNGAAVRRGPLIAPGVPLAWQILD